MWHELILGGQRSGKSRCAEARAAAWLAESGHDAVLIATALAADAEMEARIDRHRQGRAARVPGLATDEVPFALPQAIARHSARSRLVLIDCLTLWLTNLLMPRDGPALSAAACAAEIDALDKALQHAPGPVLLVSNEIGLGVSPMSAEARGFVDELGRLHQVIARRCAHVTLMVAGIEVAVKREAHR